MVRHHDEIGNKHLREFFDEDPARGRELTLTVGDLYIDYSKHRVTRETLTLLVDLAKAADLEGRRDAMFAGVHINTSEDRAVLHTALRLPRDAELTVDGQDVVADVHEVLDAMGAFTDRLRSGEWTGATGERIRTVVNIGIGGSDLGPVMVYQALRHYADAGISARFVSNVDPADLVAKLDGLDPATTLFIVASKTFSTLETLTNATAARRWLTDALGDAAVSKHFVAVSTNKKLVDGFGINTDNMFGFWDWVGGRYSVDSAIGLSVMAVVGKERFAEFLAGFHVIDEHFRTTPLEANAPVLLGLIGLWYNEFFDAQARAVLPYSNDLTRFAAYLQQLTMESNGKSVRADGSPVTTSTGEIYWGEAGNQRPARLLPTAAPGHAAGPGRLHRVLPAHRRPAHRRRHRQHARPADEQLLRPDQGAGLRQDGRGDRRRGHHGRSGPAQGDAGEPTDHLDPGDQADAVGGRPADRPLRAPGVHRGRHLGHRLVRSVGRGTR